MKMLPVNYNRTTAGTIEGVNQFATSALDATGSQCATCDMLDMFGEIRTMLALSDADNRALQALSYYVYENSELSLFSLVKYTTETNSALHPVVLALIGALVAAEPPDEFINHMKFYKSVESFQ